MQESFFSGFQVTQQAAQNLCQLVSESRWRKLQKHFTISLCFSCCRCDLLLFDLELLYEHFSTVHQVDLSYIKSLLKETKNETVSPDAQTLKLSENLITELIDLGKSTLEEKSTQRDNSGYSKKNKGVPEERTVPSDEPRKKGRPRKRSLRSSKKLTKCDVSEGVIIEEETSLPTKKIRNEKCKKGQSRTEINEDKTSTKLSSANVLQDTPAEENVNTTDGSPHAQEKDENESNDESSMVEFSDTPSHSDVVSLPLARSKGVPKRGIGRNMDSEEIKSKTCAICKEVQPSIKDCFKHYEEVHDYVPKSVYEKPPIDTKFEESKARKTKRSKGRSKTDGNAEQCNFCGKMFLKDNIDKHIHLRHYWLRIERKEQRRQTVVCHLCGKVYHHKQNLEAHVAAVHRGKPRKKPSKALAKPRVHICQNCGYTTPEIRRLKNHIAAHHEGVMPYQCDQCSFQTWEPSSWRCHKQRHSSEKKYKCTECSYQCIQRKQLRRHMSVKHQTILPKIWKRRDDGAFTNPHSNKFLQNDPEYMTVKQKQIQINRLQPIRSVKDGQQDNSAMELEENCVEISAVPTVQDQFEVTNNTENEIELIQLAPTVEISSLQQSNLGSHTGQSIPTEVVINVANNSHLDGNKAITTGSSNSRGTTRTFHSEKVIDLRNVSPSPSRLQISRQSPMIIPPAAGSSNTVHNLRSVLQEPPVLSQVFMLSKEDHTTVPDFNVGAGQRRRYYRPDFPLLQDIIEQQPSGPMFQKREDGSIVYVPKTSKERKTKTDGEEMSSSTSEKEIENDEVHEHFSEGQPIIVYETVTGDNIMATSLQLSQNQTNFVALKGKTQQVIEEAGAIPTAQTILCDEPEQVTPLEQDIAQTLIQINPLSRLPVEEQRK